MSGRPDRTQSFQERLLTCCRENQCPDPVYNILSDRRGGRTAWSSTVVIMQPGSSLQQTVQARWWYDGQHVNNAKEDAAEVALQRLISNMAPRAAPMVGAIFPKPPAPAAKDAPPATAPPATAPDASAPVAPAPAS